MQEFYKKINITADAFDLWVWMNFWSEFSQRIHTIYQLYLTQTQPEASISQWQLVVELFQDVVKKAFLNPPPINIQNPLTYAQESISLWQSLFKHPFESNRCDRRFKQEIWQDHPFYRWLHQQYLLICDYIEQQIAQLDKLEASEKRKLQFYAKQFLDALSPANFPATHPQVLKSILETKGGSMIKGLDRFIQDLKKSQGRFQISMTDMDAFEVGKNIAATPGKVIYQNDLMQLIQYNAQTQKIYQTPLLIVPPWINKYYVLDLSPHNSLVNWLVKAGYTVFMISWINPDASYANKDFEDYLLEGPLAALEVITQITGEREINAMGYCMGGTLLACMLSYLVKKRESRVKSGTYLTTLLDFSEPGDLGVFIDGGQIQQLEEKMEKEGFLDGRTMAQLFNSLRANDLIWSSYVKYYLQGETPAPMDVLFWNADSTHLPYKAHRFYLRHMYLHNQLIQSDVIQMAGVAIDLKSIEVPVFFLSTEQDHIAPWQSTYSGIHLHSGPVTFVLGGSGHVAGVINPPQHNKYYYYTCPRAYKKSDSFFRNARRNEGSWWPHWEKWLKHQSGELIPVEKRPENTLKPIEKAPGSYVKRRI